MLVDHVAKLYPQHNVAARNRWGALVCGLVRHESVGRIEVVEYAEHDWGIVEFQ